MPTLKKTKSLKRIPVGTQVKFSTQPGYYPAREGVVVAIPGEPGAGRGTYLVRVDKTPTGQQKVRPDYFRPYASRLEAQNPSKLRLVK